MKKIIIAFVMLIALLGCGNEDRLNGVVVGKDVKPGYYFTYLMPIAHTSCSGNPAVCTTYFTYIPIFYWVPPCYEITVKGETEDESGSTCVDESKWDDIEVGDTYVGKDFDPKDFKVEKKRGQERTSK